MASKISQVLALLMFTVFSLMSASTFAVSPTELFGWGKDFGKVNEVNGLRGQPDPNDKNYSKFIMKRTYAGVQFIESLHDRRIIARNDKAFHQKKIKQIQELLFQENWIIEVMSAFKYAGLQIMGNQLNFQTQANLILMVEAIRQAEEHYNAILVAFEGVVGIEAQFVKEDAKRKLSLISNFMTLYYDTNNLNIISMVSNPESAKSIADVKRTIRSVPIDHFDDEYRLHISDGNQESSSGATQATK